jgi:hypothetical protein
MQQSFTVIGTELFANSALTGGIDLGSSSLIAIEFPTSWPAGATQVTFQAKSKNTLDAGDDASAEDAENWRNVYDSAGNELVVTCGQNRVVTDIPELAPLRYIRMRSGTSATPVNVNPTQVIKFIVKEA